MISKFPYGGVPTLMGQLTKLSLSVYNFNIINNICSRKRNEDFGVDWHYITLPNKSFGNNKKLFTQIIIHSKIIL